LSLRYGALETHFESPPLLLSIPTVDDQGESEGQDDDQEHQGAEAESPAGTIVLHDRDP
jgi:hypothetical protein